MLSEECLEERLAENARLDKITDDLVDIIERINDAHDTDIACYIFTSKTVEIISRIIEVGKAIKFIARAEPGNHNDTLEKYEELVVEWNAYIDSRFALAESIKLTKARHKKFNNRMNTVLCIITVFFLAYILIK